MANYATYPLKVMGVSYAQFAVLPALTPVAQRVLRHNGRCVPQAGVTAKKAITVNGVGYASGASLAALSPPVLRRLVHEGLAG